jgi:hypothetical protein
MKVSYTGTASSQFPSFYTYDCISFLQSLLYIYVCISLISAQFSDSPLGAQSSLLLWSFVSLFAHLSSLPLASFPHDWLFRLLPASPFFFLFSSSSSSFSSVYLRLLGISMLALTEK